MKVHKSIMNLLPISLDSVWIVLSFYLLDRFFFKRYEKKCYYDTRNRKPPSMRRKSNPSKCGNYSGKYTTIANLSPNLGIFPFVYSRFSVALFFKLSLQTFVKFLALHFFYRDAIHSSKPCPLLFHELVPVELNAFVAAHSIFLQRRPFYHAEPSKTMPKKFFQFFA